MKLVAIVSVITFVLIFGTVIVVSNVLQSVALSSRSTPLLGEEDHVANERILRDIAADRDRIQREKEQMLALNQQRSVQEKVLAAATLSLQEVVTKLKGEQETYSAAKEKSARKLAKMYEAMKPVKAAPILAALDMEIILEIMSRMEERPAAKILSYMDAGLAAQISMHMSIKGEGS